MDPQQITKQLLDFNKAAFDNTFTAMTVLQDQAEKVVSMFLEQSPWIPAEGSKAISDWVKAYKKGREDFRKGVDEQYKKVEAFLNKSGKE